MRERLIDKLSIFEDFVGDPTPRGLMSISIALESYTALAVGGDQSLFSREFIDL